MTKNKVFHENGVFVYPPITVYDGTGRLTLQPLTEWKKRPIVINKRLESDFQILVTEDGGICPITENKRSDMLNFLNVFFGTMTFFGYPAYHMKNIDFTGFTWIEGEDKV